MARSIFDTEPVKRVTFSGADAWYCGDTFHRIGAPALIWPDGDQRWFYRGQLHRTDGPAVSFANDPTCWWYLYGENYSLHTWLTANTEISAEQKVMLKLQYG